MPSGNATRIDSAITVTTAPASMSWAIFRAPILPAPTTRTGSESNLKVRGSISEESDVKDFARAKVQRRHAAHDNDRRRTNVKGSEVLKGPSRRALLAGPRLFDNRNRCRSVESTFLKLLCNDSAMLDAHQDDE